MNIDDFDVRQKTLERARVELKKRFFGIDHIVDDVITRISSWYIFPDLNTRPAIICLWGMTGVGKTDLVRNLVSLLGLGDQFQEIQLSGSSKSYESSIASVLRYSKLRPNTQGVLLLDEIQRYRTVNENGTEKNEYDYSDLWMLLSDGKLPTTSSFEDVIDLLFDLEEKEKNDLAEKLAETKKPKKKKVKDTTEGEVTPAKETNVSRWRAKSLKTDLNLTESIEEIMNWTSSHVRAKVLEFAATDALVRNYDNYSKLLIVISGNLDEAFTEAFNVEDADSDADMMHELTKRINMLHIKSALLERFKPEQIARFGNNHILYPTLPRFAFEKIIDRSLETYMSFLKDKTGVEIRIVEKDIRGMIYNNSVFPSQGTRPVFSTISDFINVCFPPMVLRALKKGIKTLYIRYENERVISDQGDNIWYKGPLDEIRKTAAVDKNLQTIVAVHEAGHALMQMHVFGRAPFQLKLHNDGAGATWMCPTAESFDAKLGAVKVLYGGHAAETVVFGPELATTGASKDIQEITFVVTTLIRKCGYGPDKNVIYSPYVGDSEMYDIDINPSNERLQELTEKCFKEALNLLTFHKRDIKDLAKMLLEHRILTSEQLAAFGKIAFGKDITTTSSEQINECMYTTDYTKFLEEGGHVK